MFLRFTGEKPVEARRTFPVLGTFATVVITAPEADIQAMFFAADSLLRHLDTQLGRFSDTGQLHVLNTLHRFPLDSELGSLMLLSDSLVRATSGSFDPSLGALLVLWGFPVPEGVPDSADIYEALALTGWENTVLFRGDSVHTARGSLLDLGAVAKGYAVDRTWETLVGMGAIECLVEVGGEIRCGGSTERIWHIGVRHPRSENLAGVLSIRNGAAATSGDYECYFESEGIRYSHLLDRGTGFPSWKAAGATVVAATCAVADAMATAAAVAGPVEARAFPEDMYDSMIIITEEDNGRCEVHTFGEVPWGN